MEPFIKVPHVHAALEHLEKQGHRVLHAVTNGPTRNTVFYNYHGHPIAEFNPRRGMAMVGGSGAPEVEAPAPKPERDYEDEGRQEYNRSRGMANRSKKTKALSNQSIALSNRAMIQPSSVRLADSKLSPGQRILNELRSR